MFLDLDHFKLVSDACGHAAGDLLLMQVAEILGCAVRMQDAVARFGGDEFAILLGDCPLAQAKDSAARISPGHRGLPLRLRGWAAVPYRRQHRSGAAGRRVDVTSVIKNADAACYLAKAEGRGRVVLDESGRAAAMAAGSGGIEWGALIGQALDDDQFELHAQRIVPLGSDAGAHDPLHCEVLLRLRDGKGGLLSPGLVASSPPPATSSPRGSTAGCCATCSDCWPKAARTGWRGWRSTARASRWATARSIAT